ncbi:hypothetical protein ABZ671_15650 [Micromonospora sp. NPDC006766]|uniref:KH domain-containing protein n=1 Tax=Micromonospora sp. NPDC006766 TaxID=3154778 RepID=UPI0033C11055
MKPSVLVLLDMREYPDAPTTPAGYRELWRELEADLVRRDLRTTPTVRWDQPGHGAVSVQVLNPHSCPAVLDERTTFAVCGILEPPRLKYRCGTCADAGQARYAPFICADCRAVDPARRVCDEHVVVLDLNFARVSCPAHVPACACGQRATFWCSGAECQRRRPWCDTHRRRHPGDPLTSYCEGCYQQRFPACSAPRCASTGSLSCEHQADGRACRARVCPRHGYRWQVYGPHRRGLVLCPSHHAVLPRLSRHEIAYQILAGTAARGRGRNRAPRLPGLRTIRHIFINVRRELVEVAEIQDLMRAAAGRAGPRNRALDELIAEHRAAWAREVKEDADRMEEGQRHFGVLQSLLVGLGQADLAERIRLSEFKPHANQLWVRVPDEIKARFIGRQGTTIKELERRLGLKIKLEKL